MTPIPDLVPLHTGHPGLRTTLHVTVTPATPEAQVPSPLSPLPPVKSPSDPVSENSFSQKHQLPSPLSPLPPVKSGSDPLGENSCNSCLDFISSDSTLDRYGEIITPAGWDLRNYLRNPVFQNAHQYGDIIFTLGRALITELRSGLSTLNHQPSTYLFQRIQFAVDANPLAKIAHALYAGKFLNAVSVGFIPVRWKDGSESSSSSFSSSSSIPSESPVVSGPSSRSLPSDGPVVSGQLSRGLQAPRRIFLEQELLEVSAVSIPANPSALALAIKSGAIGKSDLKNTADLISYTLAAASPSPRGEGRGEGELRQPSTINYQPLLALSRQIRSQLKHL